MDLCGFSLECLDTWFRTLYLVCGLGVGTLMSLKVIHFQSIFLIYFYLKRLIYVQKYGITNQTVMQQVIQEKEEFLQKNGQQVDEHH